MLSFIKRAFLPIIGFLLIAVFLWFAGPYFAFGTYHPLETEFARLIAIGLVAAFWLVSALLKRWRAGRASDKLVAAVLSQPQPEKNRPPAEVVKLRERFEEAVATLKQQRRSGHSLYDLPWYVFIGAPGSGKTTALLNSGLRFPLEQRMGKGALQGVGGTRNCDWWFTDEAVFLDTAGRYTTQDSDAASDSAAWSEFLALLRKYRSRRPVNGVILTISAEDLLLQGESAREAQVEAARRRLNELNQELNIQLPIYLMVTKCDLVAGFTEYFDELTQEGRAQVWGVTFPYEQTVNGDAPRAFLEEFDALMGRLNARVFGRIEEERDSRRRTKVFGFPQQMAGLRDVLGQFVSDVFSSTRLDKPILLRGVYFTSGTQDGTPIDRLLGAIGRRFGVASEAVAASTTGRGKAYFVERLLKEVLIGESGLAGVNRRVEVRNAAVLLGAYAAMALLAVLGVVALSVSYRNNQAFIAGVAADLARLREVPSVSPTAPIEALLPRLDAIRTVVDSADRYRSDTPFMMRWGLYQGGSVGNSARDAYRRELDGILLPRFAARVKERLGEYASEPEKLYVYLKAYLMLGDPSHLDKEYLQFLADLEWNRTDGVARATGASPSKHFESLLADDETLRPIGVDPALIAQARSTIRRASIPQIMYGRLKRSHAEDTNGVRLDVAAGAGFEQVLRRRSGVSLSEPVPALYSKAVFEQATGPGMIEVVKQFAQDGWVWGEGGLSMANPVTLAADVTQLYERDYIAAWDDVLNDLEPVPFSTVSQTANALGILAGSASPLRGLLKAIDDNTFLVPDAAAAPTGVLSSAQKSLTEGLGKLLKPVQKAIGQSSVAPGSLVTAHFQEIHRLLVPPGSSPLDTVLAGVGQIQQQLSALGPAVGASDPLEALSNPALRGILQALQQQGAALPPPVDKFIVQIGEKAEGSVIAGATDDLQERYERQVLKECNAILTDRYPFAPSSTSNDVPLTDFGRLFGYDGLFDSFFKANMENLVDTATTPWTWRPRAVTSSQRLLAQFELAKRIRETFFSSTASKAPEIHFTVAVTRVDTGARQRRFILEIDGQRFDDRTAPGQKGNAVWPARGAGMAVATFEDSAGAFPSVKFDGPWALFRLIDSARPQPNGDLGTFLTFQTGAYQARVAVEAASILNPFAQRDWRGFRCEP